MLKALNVHQDNFKIIDVEYVNHLHRYILKLYDENFVSHFPTASDYCSFITITYFKFYVEFFAAGCTNFRQVFEKHIFLGKAIEKSHMMSN
jgi:hypothetical protein